MKKIIILIYLFLMIIFVPFKIEATSSEDAIIINNNNIFKELLNQKKYYESLLLKSDDFDKEKIQNLLFVNQAMIDYKKYGVTTYSDIFTEFFLFDAVITVNAYFNANSYFLSSELLLQSLYNEEVDSFYTPINEHINRIIETDVFLGLVDGREVEGTSAFGYSRDRSLQDLCYSIHGFIFEKDSPTSQTVKIYDRYDYDSDHYGWESIEGIMVNTMFEAQNAGVITPFRIELEYTIPCQYNTIASSMNYHIQQCIHCEEKIESRHLFEQYKFGLKCKVCGFYTEGNVSIER